MHKALSHDDYRLRPHEDLDATTGPFDAHDTHALQGTVFMTDGDGDGDGEGGDGSGSRGGGGEEGDAFDPDAGPGAPRPAVKANRQSMNIVEKTQQAEWVRARKQVSFGSRRV